MWVCLIRHSMGLKKMSDLEVVGLQSDSELV